MSALFLFVCVSAAVVLTNGVILGAIALYITHSLRSAAREEVDRLEKIQNAGAESLGRLLSRANRMKDPFDNGGGVA